MYPNPQDVLPLPERPDREWYRKQAKDLVKACRSGDPEAYAAWAERLARDTSYAKGLADFAATQMTRQRRDAGCTQADALFVVARAFGFPSWPAFRGHLDALEHANSTQSAFESAADAIVSGDVARLRELLRADPSLVHARSTREHRATLLHYVAANGVENYRQRTPKNAPEIARVLLDAGAEVNAEAEMYGGGATTLGLTATSVHPEEAGVQLELLDLLLERGARLDDPDAAGNNHGVVLGCLANGQPAAARYLADRGARLDLEGAAGIGRLDAVRGFFDGSGRPRPPVPEAQVTSAFAYACGYGQHEVARFLLDHGVEPDRTLRMYGEGHTGLHVAAYHAHVEVATLLLERGASVTRRDETWKTEPLVWALQGWGDDAGDVERYYATVELLVRAGSPVEERLLADASIAADARMLALLRPGADD